MKKHLELFEEYNKEMPEIYRRYKRIVSERIQMGVRSISSQKIFNEIRKEIRYEMSIRNSRRRFKLDNNYAPIYARKFISDYPKYSYLFKFRKTKHDEH